MRQIKTTVSCQTAECSTVMDQRQRNFKGRSQQFWSSVLSGHLDLPTVLTLPKLEIIDSRYGTASWWRLETFVDEKTELEVYSFSNQEPM